MTTTRDIKTVHDLKIWPNYFSAVRCGDKTFELRNNDRDFRVGDELNLREYDPVNKIYSGQTVRCIVTDIICSPHWGLADGYCIMSIKLIDDLQATITLLERQRNEARQFGERLQQHLVNAHGEDCVVPWEDNRDD